MTQQYYILKSSTTVKDVRSDNGAMNVGIKLTMQNKQEGTRNLNLHKIIQPNINKH